MIRESPSSNTSRNSAFHFGMLQLLDLVVTHGFLVWLHLSFYESHFKISVISLVAPVETFAGFHNCLPHQGHAESWFCF